MDVRSESLLAGRKGLVVGIANEHSIAYGCARVLRACGAELAVTWLNDKARPHVESLARELAAPITEPLDVERPGELESVFDAIRGAWGRLDFAAGAPGRRLQRRRRARRPRADLVLTSRVDPREARIASCAVALVVARRGANCAAPAESAPGAPSRAPAAVELQP